MYFNALPEPGVDERECEKLSVDLRPERDVTLYLEIYNPQARIPLIVTPGGMGEIDGFGGFARNVAAHASDLKVIIWDRRNMGRSGINFGSEPLSMEEAQRKYPGLRIAATGAVAKDLEGGIRVIHDGTHGVLLNQNIRVRDQVAYPGLAEARWLMAYMHHWGLLCVGAKGDVRKARRRVKVKTKDHPKLGAKLMEDEAQWLRTQLEEQAAAVAAAAVGQQDPSLGLLNEDEQILLFTIVKEKMQVLADECSKILEYQLYKDLMREVRLLESEIVTYQDELRSNIQQRQLKDYVEIGEETL